MNNSQMLAMLATIGIVTSQATPALAKNHEEAQHQPAASQAAPNRGQSPAWSQPALPNRSAPSGWSRQAVPSRAAAPAWAQQASRLPVINQGRGAPSFQQAANNYALRENSDKAARSFMSRLMNREPVVPARQYAIPTTPIVNNPGLFNWKHEHHFVNNNVPVANTTYGAAPVVYSPAAPAVYSSAAPVVYSPGATYLSGPVYGLGNIMSTADIDSQKVSLAQGIQFAMGNRSFRGGPATQLAMMLNQLNADESNAVARDGGAGVTAADHANLENELQGISTTFSQMGGGYML